MMTAILQRHERAVARLRAARQGHRSSLPGRDIKSGSFQRTITMRDLRRAIIAHVWVIFFTSQFVLKGDES